MTRTLPPTKKRNAAMLLLALALSACSPSEPGPDPLAGYPVISAPKAWPSSVSLLPDEYRGNVQVTDTRAWTVTHAPQWLSAQLVKRPETRHLLLAAGDVTAQVPADAQAETVSGTVRLKEDFTTTTAAVTVHLDLLTVTGRVAAPADTAQATAQGTAALPAGPGRVLIEYPGGRLETRAVPDVAQAAAQLRQQAGVRRVVPDVTFRAAADWPPGDTLAPLQWEALRIGMPALLGLPAGAAVTVAVLDTGVKYAHPDLQGRLWPVGDGPVDLLNYTANGDGDGMDSDPDDAREAGNTEGSHGTHVTGLITARQDGAGPRTGIVGRAATQAVTVLPVRVLDQHGEGPLSAVVAGLRYAAGLPVTFEGRTFTNPHPAPVINLSLGLRGSQLTSDTIALLCGTVADVTAAGSLVVAAAGNDGTVDDPAFPAACPGAVNVASVTLDAQGNWVRAPYSNASSSVTLSAPGGDDTEHNGLVVDGRRVPDLILSTDWDYAGGAPAWSWQAGTSMAAPTVSALAAALVSQGLARTPAELHARLRATADDVAAPGADAGTGAGVVNFQRALDQAVTVPTPAPVTREDLLVEITGRGRTFHPPVTVDAEGAFTFKAHLPPGAYVVNTGVDTNADGRLDSGEVRNERAVTLERTDVDLSATRSARPQK